MGNRPFSIGIAFVGLLVATAPAFAHHSFAAEYDSKKPVTITGVVTKIDWMNPHVYFYVDVKDANNKVTSWALEMGAPSMLTRSGWSRTTMHIGDVVTVEGSLAKDGRPHANAKSVMMTATGKKLGAASSEGAYKPEEGQR